MPKINQNTVLIISVLVIVGNAVFCTMLQYKSGKRFMTKKQKVLSDFLDMNKTELEDYSKSIVKQENSEQKDTSKKTASKNSVSKITTSTTQKMSKFDVWNKKEESVGILFVKRENELFVNCSSKHVTKVVDFAGYVERIRTKGGSDGAEIAKKLKTLQNYTQNYATTSFCKVLIKDNKCHMLFDEGPSFVFTHKGEEDVYNLFEITQ